MTETWIRPAPKHLAMLAQEMRADWPYEDTRQALIACHAAGWEDEQIYRQTFRLLLLKDSAPADLRQAARSPLRPVPAAGDETFSRGLASVREAYVNRKPYDHASGSEPDGGEVA